MESQNAAPLNIYNSEVHRLEIANMNIFIKLSFKAVDGVFFWKPFLHIDINNS